MDGVIFVGHLMMDGTEFIKKFPRVEERYKYYVESKFARYFCGIEDVFEGLTREQFEEDGRHRDFFFKIGAFVHVELYRKIPFTLDSAFDLMESEMERVQPAMGTIFYALRYFLGGFDMVLECGNISPCRIYGLFSKIRSRWSYYANVMNDAVRRLNDKARFRIFKDGGALGLVPDVVEHINRFI